MECVPFLYHHTLLQSSTRADTYVTQQLAAASTKQEPAAACANTEVKGKIMLGAAGPYITGQTPGGGLVYLTFLIQSP
jgi:hypothetical protein